MIIYNVSPCPYFVFLLVSETRRRVFGGTSVAGHWLQPLRYGKSATDGRGFKQKTCAVAWGVQVTVESMP